MRCKAFVAMLALVILSGCASTIESKNGAFRECFSPDMEARKDTYQIYSVGNEQGGTAAATMLLIGIPIVIPSVQMKADITLDEAIQETCRVAYHQDCLAEAYRLGNEPAEVRVKASVYFRDGLKKIIKIEIYDDRQKLSPGDVKIYSNWREYTLDGSGLKLVRENIPETDIRDLSSSIMERRKGI